MPDMDELIPSEQDEEIYAAWEGGKTLRVLAREFRLSVMAIEQAIDHFLPVFSTQTQMRAYKREIQKLEDLGTKYYAKAMPDEIESAHLYARINERYCAMQGWTSVKHSARSVCGSGQRTAVATRANPRRNFQNQIRPAVATE